MESLGIATLQEHWVDVAMLAWLLVSMLVGLARGLVFETFSLIGWVVAYFAAQWAWPMLAPQLPVGTPGSALNHAASFVCVFFVVLLAWGLTSRMVRMVVRATPLKLPDRVLGAGFGAARGLLVLLLVAAGVSLTPLAGSLAWKQSQCAAWLNVALHGLRPLLPDDLSRRLPT